MQTLTTVLAVFAALNLVLWILPMVAAVLANRRMAWTPTRNVYNDKVRQELGFRIAMRVWRVVHGGLPWANFFVNTQSSGPGLAVGMSVFGGAGYCRRFGRFEVSGRTLKIRLVKEKSRFNHVTGKWSMTPTVELYTNPNR